MLLSKIKTRIVQKIRSVFSDEKVEMERLELQVFYLKKMLNESRRIGGKKIHIVFVCHRPQLWSSLQSICEACMVDDSFQVTIVAIPSKKQLSHIGYEHEIYESEGAERFFMEKYPCTVAGYNYETEEWLDLFLLKPDYVFFQTPYDSSRPMIYHSAVVSTYAKICYVPYGVQTLGGNTEKVVYPVTFFKNVSYLFVENRWRTAFLDSVLAKSRTINEVKIYNLGYPRYDNLKEYYGVESKSWVMKGNDRLFRIIWTPRWSTNEGNCNFFEYKDEMLKLVEEYSGKMELLFRPHPQMFPNFLATKEMSVQEIEHYMARYAVVDNASIDSQESYIESFYSSDVLITDPTSIMPEYFLTGKPIIYCYKGWNDFTEFGQKLSEGFYWANNWNDVCHYVKMLMDGEDPLYEKRQRMISELFELSDISAGYRIKEKLKKEYEDAL